ncbi:S66 family peptidase [Eubacterium xylanophilum]|uniref:S66 family peptidase n=1 Tax=Eubacterium xylanophilum TaxID=39497 RepID=UPI00047E4681|nr:S66 peptidase family protein [Eubacterium xylanophilum]
MIYPDFLKNNDKILVTAPSGGNYKEMDLLRVDRAKETLENKGFRVEFTENVKQNDGRGRSSSKEDRARQLMQGFIDPEVKFIHSAKGGDFLMEVMPLLDWSAIEANPTWFQGFSDNTFLTYIIATNYHIATIYGNHFNDYAMEPWHDAVKNNWSIITGENIIQKTFDMYEDGFYDKEKVTDGYITDKKSKPILLTDGKTICKTEKDYSQSVEMSGRLIGGCMDVLLNICGTRYDRTREYVDSYKQDGFIFYLESFSLDTDSVARGLWQLDEAGWFEHCKGFIFGRPCMCEAYTDHTYAESVLTILEEKNAPIILDADIGHKSPQFTIINGAKGNIQLNNNTINLSVNLC